MTLTCQSPQSFSQSLIWFLKQEFKLVLCFPNLLRKLHLRNRPSVSLPAIDRDQIKVNYVINNEKQRRSPTGSPFCVQECRPSMIQSIPCPNPCRWTHWFPLIDLRSNKTRISQLIHRFRGFTTGQRRKSRDHLSTHLANMFYAFINRSWKLAKSENLLETTIALP